ncbi:thioredoxin domain-containing protein [Candidatus Pacearchaeota archaeon]|nr:thioredoxin domain-containing protein [Candidatus Pacearchaeota archaeon]
MPDDEVIEIKVPKFFHGDFTENMRKNPWIVSTLVFLILSLVLMGNSLWGTKLSTSFGTVSPNSAGNALVDFLNQNTNSSVSLKSVSTESGLYKINLDYQGQIVPLYTTTDGKFLIQNLVPLSLDNSNSNSGENKGADAGVFLNNPSLYPSLGPQDAETTVIEFSDFQCPFCAMASGLPLWISQYQSQYGDLLGAAKKVQDLAEQGKLKFVYVSMSFLGQESVYAAEAGLCANEQGKFWEMHDAIFTAQTQGENNGKFNKDKLEIIANSVSGIDKAKFKTCLESDKELSDVQKIAQESGSIVQGTPMFFVNGKQVQASWSAIEKEIGN